MIMIIVNIFVYAFLAHIAFALLWAYIEINLAIIEFIWDKLKKIALSFW